MGQATAVTSTTDERRWSLAVRPLLLLGGFALVWLFLLTGTAQASGGDGRDLADTARAATGNVERVVDREVRRSTPAPKAHQQHRAPVKKVTRTVRHRVQPVVSATVAPVASAAKQTVQDSVKPVTTRATDTIRSTVDKVHKVAKDVRSTLDNGPVVVPELHPTELDTPSVSGESSTSVGETRSSAPRANRFEAPAPVLPVADLTVDLGTPGMADFAAQTSAPSSGQDTAERTPLGGADHDGVVDPAGHDEASFVQSGSGSAPAADVTASSHVVAPDLDQTSTLTSADRLPAGPAYPPAASPD
jgi:hypothetical protein